RHYQGAEHDTLYGLDPARDSTELRLTRLILERRFPTLAVCRGMQLINIVLGGSLHVHLPEVYGEAIAHRAPPREPIPHSIEIAADSRLARQLGATRTEIVSWHHQAIDRLGAGLRAVAWADDGVIEAVELDGFERLIAVQWHPELSAECDPRQQALFDALVAMVR
ncbi:MAG TPA: gamma-glutamyl-gamma-aminobutyrate hydrolase family protein, partial [Roseiflexaceae bacterium]|nr:gamma-glutamyl-gamma-aminobutyrate hydrolase family protein [Roseiflexaceae bacterium]